MDISACVFFPPKTRGWGEGGCWIELHRFAPPSLSGGGDVINDFLNTSLGLGREQERGPQSTQIVSEDRVTKIIMTRTVMAEKGHKCHPLFSYFDK